MLNWIQIQAQVLAYVNLDFLMPMVERLSTARPVGKTAPLESQIAQRNAFHVMTQMP